MSSVPVRTTGVAAPVRAAAATSIERPLAPTRVADALTEPDWVRRTLIGVALAFLTLFLFVPLIAVFAQAFAKGIDRLLGRGDRRGGALRAQAHADRGADIRPLQPRLRRRGGLGDREVRLSRQEPAADADRPAVFGLAGDRRPRLRAGLRAAGLARRVAARPRPEDHLRHSRHRAGDHLRDLPLHRARTDPADAGPGRGAGGSGTRARRIGMADPVARHAAEREVGAAVRRDPVQCPGDGRVRRGQRRLGAHPGPDQHAAPAHRDPLQRVPVRGSPSPSRPCWPRWRWSRSS